MANQPTWVTSLGDNSVRIDYPAGATVADLQDTIDGWLVLHGWEVYDSNAGTGKKVYRALCLDATAYKYVQVYVTTAAIQTNVYEAWDVEANTGTNPASGGTQQVISTTNGGTIFLFAKAAYCIVLSLNGATYGDSVYNSFTGIVEITRDNAEDTAAAGYPCWASICGTLMMNSAVIGFPRTRDGSTGAGACTGTYLSWRGGFSGYYQAGNLNGNTFLKAGKLNAWSNKNLALTLYTGKWASADTVFEHKGRVMGLILLQKALGSMLDTIPINLDANGFPDPSGTSTNCAVLSANTASGGDARVAVPW